MFLLLNNNNNNNNFKEDYNIKIYIFLKKNNLLSLFYINKLLFLILTITSIRIILIKKIYILKENT
jgi:hypothetical protein